jgi:hypothetical protein
MLGKNASTFRTIVLTIAALILAATLLSAARAQDPSQPGDVAAAARKSRADQKNAPKNTKIYTDDDVKPATPDPPPPAAPANSAAGTATGAASTTEDGKPPADVTKPAGQVPPASTDKSDKNDEQTWRKRFAAQRDQIARAEKELDVLEREEDKAQVQYYPDPQKALSEGYSRKDINEKDTKIAAKKDEIAKLKQGLSDLEDQLRAAGGDSGWARE